jgi:hypothetical protein
MFTPRSWVEKAYPNVIYFNEVDKGGHFAAWEEPGLFSEELRAAFRPLALASLGVTCTTGDWPFDGPMRHWLDRT